MRLLFSLLILVALPAAAHHEGHAHGLAANAQHAQLSWNQLLSIGAGLLVVAGLCRLLGLARSWRRERNRRRQFRVQALVPLVGRSHGGHVD